MSEEEIQIKIKKLQSNIQICVSRRERYNEIMKYSKSEIVRLNNSIRNNKIKEDVKLAVEKRLELNPNGNIDYFLLFRRLGVKYGLNGGTIKGIYYNEK